MKDLPHDAPSGAQDGPDTILVLRAGDAVPEVAQEHGEFVSWIQRSAGDVWGGDWLEHDLRTDAPIPEHGEFAAVIITGSASSVTERAQWMLRAEDYLRGAAAREAPVLGICFGHQLLAQALGGEVRRNPSGREIGTVELALHGEDDPLFTGLPARIAVNATHVDSVAILPAGAKCLGRTELEPHAVVAYGSRVRGVQFHPEIDGAVMRGYVEVRRERLREENLDADAALAGVVDTPVAVELLRNFFRYFVVAPLRRAAGLRRAA